MIKRSVKNTLWSIGIILIFLSSCSIIRYTNPDAPDWAVGVLKTNDDVAVRIDSVDGKKAIGTFRGEKVFEYPDSVTLLPGFHTVVPCYLNLDGAIEGEPLSFYVQEENEYIIQHKIKWDKSIHFWIECNGVDISTEY